MKAGRGRRARVAAALVAALAAMACANDTTRLVPDTVSPRIWATFPTGRWPAAVNATFDRDSDGLLELDLRWADSLGHVLPGSLSIT